MSDDDVPIGVLFGILFLLLLLSAFFSGTETALMSLNRYRLRHAARSGHRGARLAEQLLRRPDRLIGLILIGNNLVNFTAASLTTLIALRIGGEPAVAIGVGVFTFAVLIFAEVAPKTMAALHPERLAIPAAYVYHPLLKVAYPAVWLVNLLANAFLRLLGAPPEDDRKEALSPEELRTVVAEAGAMIPRRHQRMLLRILDLEKVTVEDIMVPRHEVIGIDLNDDWDTIVTQIETSQHTRLPVYRDSIDNIVGMLHMRTVAHELLKGELTKTRVERIARSQEPYFVPEGTPLHIQLLHFQRNKRRRALVVDEYGDIQGLVTLEDILEEIVGEFTTDPSALLKDVYPEPGGTYVVAGSANVRELNRMMDWNLPTDGPKTLNGIIVEHLETIPKPGTDLKLLDYPIEILQTSENAIKTVRIRPPAVGGQA